MKKQLPDTSCQLSALDRWGGYVCTAVLTIAGLYFAGQLVYAWWLGRFTEVAR